MCQDRFKRAHEGGHAAQLRWCSHRSKCDITNCVLDAIGAGIGAMLVAAAAAVLS